MSDPGSCWPTPAQELLLDTIVSRDDGVSRRAWERWRASHDLDDIDGPSVRLLPAVYRRLVELDVDDPLRGRFKGLWRKSWYENQKALDELSKVIADLEQRGIATIVLKGLALGLTVYRDPGERPCVDADLLVPLSEAERSLRLLLARGAEPLVERPLALLNTLHAVPLRLPTGLELDLHWYVAQAFCDEATNHEVWARAERVAIRGVGTRVPDSTDQLSQTLVHGAHWNPEPPIRWVADAARILRADGAIDWDRLASRAERFDVALLHAKALAYLRDRFDLPVPRSVVERLRRRRLRLWEWLELHFRQAPADRGLLGNFPRTLLHYRRLSRQRPWWRRVAELPAFLRDWWELDELGAVPRLAATKAAERFVGVTRTRRTAPRAGPRAGEG